MWYAAIMLFEKYNSCEENMKYKTIDLFAGAGGLSLGFMQTGKFDIKVAFENNPAMQETYRKNHPNTDVFSDVCDADYKHIIKEYGDIDVVIGGPPCQGFSNANRQKNHAINMNNMLVKQYIRAIVELQPKAFVMENVSMLKSDTHRFFMDKADEEVLKSISIKSKTSRLVLIEPEYSFDGAADIVQDINLIKNNFWSEKTYKELNVVYKATSNSKKFDSIAEKHKKNILKIIEDKSLPQQNKHIKTVNTNAFVALNDYYNSEAKISCKDLRSELEPMIMIQRMLSKAKEIIDNCIIVSSYEINNGIVAKIKSFSVYDYITAILTNSKNNYVINSGILCAADFGAPQKRDRFVIIGVKKNFTETIKMPLGEFNSDNYRTVKDAIGDLQTVEAVTNASDDTGKKLRKQKRLSDLAKVLRDSDLLYNHIVTDTTCDAMERFKNIKQGQNFHSLPKEMQTNTYTDPTRTQNTIYLRLDYNKPSGTVVNVRKSMWIHPKLNRAISVREAARLQTFPDSFRFYGSKDKQYQQVGNAVPPILANAIAKALVKEIEGRGI